MKTQYDVTVLKYYLKTNTMFVMDRKCVIVYNYKILLYIEKLRIWEKGIVYLVLKSYNIIE